ncbi:MAG: transposase [Bacilli bacterium]
MYEEKKKKEIKPEEKINAVKELMVGEISQEKIGKKYGVNRDTVRRWYIKYTAFGESVFTQNCHNIIYTAEFKNKVVKSYLNGDGSYKDIAIKFKIHSSTTILKWVKEYNRGKTFTDFKREETCKMVNGKGRKTTYEERLEAVKYCFENKNDYVETALKFKISYQQIYYWCKKFKSEGPKALLDKRGKKKTWSEMTELEKVKEENRLLRIQNEYVKMENEFLKKVKELERW